ncbi:EVE domain-containing protein [Lysobacter dokdonensis DS-58]|uniref:EVE domain-containing protein n=1 Tax=Lysobacter dokdonensis DS-58 TaxID=1300345 RepID=A0A0A2WK01_9GAMM|nr:EVE domain-containing protein [Lysobacter dokdonensis]KGQ20118.1 EVE domain-containing protein [Lysobacter dokdonensis DS-58]
MSSKRRYWLMKTEPDTFSIDDLERVRVEPWNGVRNYQARNHMRAMQPGDGVFLYHSSCAVPGIAGLAKVATAAYPDPTQFDKKSDYYDPKSTREEPRWSLVDVEFERKFAQPITLETIKAHADQFDGEFALIRRGNRLSVLPVTAAQWKQLLKLEQR